MAPLISGLVAYGLLFYDGTAFYSWQVRDICSRRQQGKISVKLTFTGSFPHFRDYYRLHGCHDYSLSPG